MTYTFRIIKPKVPGASSDAELLKMNMFYHTECDEALLGMLLEGPQRAST